MDASNDAAIALARLGLGARPGEIRHVGGDPRGWAVAQIRADGAPQPSGDFSDTDRRMAAFLDYQSLDRRPDGAEAEVRRAERQAARRALVQGTGEEFLARARLGATTDRSFAERWALFWANAITVSATRFPAAVFMGQYEREAIRPFVFGRFEDLVLAAEQHPAMLLYLDQARSIGPGSAAGRRRRNGGLNENLAREMMELHTVGAEAGYDQADVTELARALTGWSVPTAGDEAPERERPAFIFRNAAHEPGARIVMGKTYPPDGLAQGRAILRDLARHPATARRLAHRLAVHFVADDPPPALVEALERRWIETEGDLAELARALVQAEETWSLPLTKMKTPYEFVVSTHRALGTQPDRLPALRSGLMEMGQPVFAAPSPEGWPDMAADWAGPDALVKRLNWARSQGDAARIDDPGMIAAQVLGPRLSDRTRLAVTRAESRSEAVALFLMSPEFQRR